MNIDVSSHARVSNFAGKVLVHEWGHLRWGLFDEYPVSSDIREHFYYSPRTGSIEASKCNDNIKGNQRHRITLSSCKINATSSLPEEHCRFYANEAASKGTSSMMYYQYLSSVSIFCNLDKKYNRVLENMKIG